MSTAEPVPIVVAGDLIVDANDRDDYLQMSALIAIEVGEYLAQPGGGDT